MAKKDEKKALGGILAAPKKTEPEKPTKAEEIAPEDDIIKPTSFGLKLSERMRFDEIAGELGVARNALGRFAIRKFIKDYEAGEVEIKTAKVTKKVIL